MAFPQLSSSLTKCARSIGGEYLASREGCGQAMSAGRYLFAETPAIETAMTVTAMIKATVSIVFRDRAISLAFLVSPSDWRESFEDFDQSRNSSH
jgi:hypothetical protein